MRKTTALFCLLVMTAAPAGAQEKPGRELGNPRFSLEGLFQFWWQWEEKDAEHHSGGTEQFQSRRVHLTLRSEPSESSRSVITLSMLHSATLDAALYEAWIKKILSPSWSVTAGYFLPPWTLEMPKPLSDLKFIRYPLIVDSGQNLFTPWQQTGIMLSVTPGERLYFAVGLMNGLDAAGLLGENNAMKDTMVVVALEAFPGLRLHFGHWGGKTELLRVTLAPGEFVSLPFGLSARNTGLTPLIAGGGVVEHLNTWLGLEFSSSSLDCSAEALWHRADRDGERLRNSQGYHLSLLYSRPPWQAAFRYEFYEPNSDDSAAGKNDEMEWTTLGFNYQPRPSLKLMVNYLFKTERGENQIRNNQLLLQLSLLF